MKFVFTVFLLLAMLGLVIIAIKFLMASIGLVLFIVFTIVLVSYLSKG